VLLAAARELLGTATPMIESRGITLLGVSLTNLQNEAPMQLALPFEERKPAALDAALDHVRDRFGSRSVTRATLLGRDPGISVPLLPD
jgi:DNA polymerase-4